MEGDNKGSQEFGLAKLEEKTIEKLKMSQPAYLGRSPTDRMSGVKVVECLDIEEEAYVLFAFFSWQIDKVNGVEAVFRRYQMLRRYIEICCWSEAT